ncbi:hypothetical protein JMJ77_0006926 [Colletotrichum scovillei]|uniref:Uncharacterized protein n=1 Tax=Colletotrichum scovillei TaxID=1209932 RepID=A0A9P7UID5_9PEZI|nr:hypothetical protein JMJ77_0006926 [Colletotrichum scovillei]KAG7073886.1 hypothetical protein JMJ76_0010381 [Colletotrichum scovillei]KAG7081462.1 hypothetical protein JMJ78_0003585 [Colletotrichum scovillei]
MSRSGTCSPPERLHRRVAYSIPSRWKAMLHAMLRLPWARARTPKVRCCTHSM